MSDLGPPDDELTALFRAEWAEHVFGESLRAGVLRGVERAVLLAPMAGVGAAAGAVIAKGWQTKTVILLGTLAFGAGGVAGVVGTKLVAPPAPAVSIAAPTRLELPPITLVPVPSSEPSVTPVPPLDVAPAIPPRPPPASTTQGSSPSTLARETEIIETGRSAMARGRHADALAAVGEHRRLFPHGRLAEEREELAIRALRAAGRNEEASSRAEQFTKTYPSSIYSGTVNATPR